MHFSYFKVIKIFILIIYRYFFADITNSLIVFAKKYSDNCEKQKNSNPF